MASEKESGVPKEAQNWKAPEEKVVDRRASTLEKRETEKGMENLKSVFGFTDEEIGALQEVLPEKMEEMLKSANRAVENAGENAGLLTKYAALTEKMRGFGYKLPSDEGLNEVSLGANGSKFLAEQGKKMADLLKAGKEGKSMHDVMTEERRKMGQ